MKKLYSLLVMALLVLSIIPVVFATGVGIGVGVDINTEDYAPNVWMCGDRVLVDDPIQPGLNGANLAERINNYAFEGESIAWNVLVMDKNGINKVEDVFATIGDVQGAGNDIEVNCVESTPYSDGLVNASCNARILEESLTGNPIDITGQDVLRYYTCTLTVETQSSMYGEYWITVEAVDLDGLSGTMAENEYWFLNPIITLEVAGDLVFNNVRPGTDSYSSTLLVGNDADDGSGVILDMFISGTDFYDSSSSGAMCPTGNVLDLSAFKYFATNGAYSTFTNFVKDAEGYAPIKDGSRIDQAYEIIGDDKFGAGAYNNGNTLTPGAEMALTFKLTLPEPCNGDFDSGTIYFWGEAI